MSEKRAPVQGFAAGIPWEMHLRAYDAYCKKYRPQQALIEGGCRGGFSTGELDMFIPGWREELSERAKDRSTIASLQAEVARLRDAMKPTPKECEESDYSDALRFMRAGAKMRRRAWRPNKFVHVISPANSLTYLEMVLTDGKRAPYTPSRCDQFEADWIDATDIARAALGGDDA